MIESPDKAVEVREVVKIFDSQDGQVRALDGDSLTINDNEFFTLLGPSGCGKTTLLRLIAGFDHPTSGAIRLHGEDIAHLPPYKRPVNTVFQNYALFPHMTVAENIAFGLEMLKAPKAGIAAAVDEMLELVQMAPLKNRRTSEISGGQQQRVALARALAPRPRVLLLDEPLSALDYKLRKDMQIELKRLQHETGITFVFVTHDQEEALTMSDRIAVMNAGKVLQVGSPQEIYNHPAARFVANFIGESNFLQAELISGGDHSNTGTVKLPSGKELRASMPEGGVSSSTVTLMIRPENAHVADDPSECVVTGTVDNVVYFGTDTHYHLTLEDGTPFILRSQNSGANSSLAAEGDVVGVEFDADAPQILRD